MRKPGASNSQCTLTEVFRRDPHRDVLAWTGQIPVRAAGDMATAGYDIRTELLNTRIDELYAESPGRVVGTGPPGDLDAGRMILTNDADTGDAQLLFTDGVKLVYTPQPPEDD